MVVMVLAPCAVVHAASMKSTPHAMAASSMSHGQHVDCHSSQQDAKHTDCSSDCDTLQRVAEAGAQERSAPDFNASYFVIVLALTLVATTLDNTPSAKSDYDYEESTSYSKTVLRQTARLRL